MWYFSTPTDDNVWKPGDLYLGRHSDRPIGLPTERHAITIAGSRSGKGVSVIRTNATYWQDNLLVVDPKGEVASTCWEARLSKGQATYVIDPFRASGVPAQLLGCFNPLDGIDPDSLTAREDVRVIADGLVVRSDPKHHEWDEGAVTVLAGVIAHVIKNAPPGQKTLMQARELLMKPPEDLQEIFSDMAGQPSFGGLARAAASMGLSTAKFDQECVQGAKRHTGWLDSPPMATILSNTNFDLSALSTTPMSVFLVLPPKYLNQHGSFLRLFVLCALNAMSKESKEKRPCLFILDEFFSLGRITEIEKSAGLMAGYGVRLWPFLQDLGQLWKLYGKDGAATFFGNSDVHMFFGTSDIETLEYISRKIGNLTSEEAAPILPEVTVHESPNVAEPWIGEKEPEWMRRARSNDLKNASIQDANERTKVQAENSRRATQYQRDLNNAGKPRMPPDAIASIVMRPPGEKQIANSMIVFTPGKNVWNLKLERHFLQEDSAPSFNKSEPPAPTATPAAPPTADSSRITWDDFTVLDAVITLIILHIVSSVLIALSYGKGCFYSASRFYGCSASLPVDAFSFIWSWITR